MEYNIRAFSIVAKSSLSRPSSRVLLIRSRSSYDVPAPLLQHDRERPIDSII